MTTRISIVMTTYNGELYLPRQLRSFRAQTRLPDELVVCDDASTDSTLRILSEFAKSAPFEVRIALNATNLGHERNFSQAVDLANGDLIFLADQDDDWYPSKLERVERIFVERPNSLLVVNDVMITDHSLHSTGRTVLGQMRASGMIGQNAKSLTLGCATAFRDRLRWLVAPIPALDYGHDSWIHDFTEALGGRTVLPEILQLYRRHSANASNWMFNNSDRASSIQLARPTMHRDLTAEYAKRIRALSLMRDRLEALGPKAFANVGAPRSYGEVSAYLSRAIEAVQRRTDMFRLGPIPRKSLAVRMLIGGDYQYFLGWRSFAKDLLR